MEKMVTADFSGYAGKRVLITGDTGFKGSWLALWLTMLGAEVRGYALPPERPEDHYHLLQLGNLIHHTDGDVRDFEAMYNTMKSFQPEVVFHLAAQPIVSASYQAPKATFDTNVGGGINVMECVRLIDSIRAFVCVTSDKCYWNNEWVWGYRENDELGGKDPYSASKAAVELVFTGYQSSFFNKRDWLGSATVRAGNVIGGGDWAADRIVPDCIRALKLGKNIVLRNPWATRPWQHVLEPLSGYLLLGLKLLVAPVQYGGSWNFGPDSGNAKSVDALAQKLVEEWGCGAVEHSADSVKIHEAGLLQLNSDKARQLLGWRPVWNFARTVAEIAHWYKEQCGDADIKSLSAKQIEQYMDDRKLNNERDGIGA